ncbi:MAG TPA: metallophosphoesterase family protein [Gemmatimonadaceae bacterium]
MRLGIISDVHGNVVALRRVIEHLAMQSVDVVVNLGDCVSAPLWPRETFDELQQLDAITVRGNHDRVLGDPNWVVDSPTIAFTISMLSGEIRSTLGALPVTRMIDGDILAVHGTPASDVQYLLEDSVDGRLCYATTATLGERLAGTTSSLVLCGHSHQQHTAWAPGQRLVINPGSVGHPRYAGNTDPNANEASSAHARYAVATRRNGAWSVDLFVLDYDWDAVAERAREVGRDDWAGAFMRG